MVLPVRVKSICSKPRSVPKFPFGIGGCLGSTFYDEWLGRDGCPALAAGGVGDGGVVDGPGVVDYFVERRVVRGRVLAVATARDSSSALRAWASARVRFPCASATVAISRCRHSCLNLLPARSASVNAVARSPRSGVLHRIADNGGVVSASADLIAHSGSRRRPSRECPQVPVVQRRHGGTRSIRPPRERTRTGR